MNRLGSRAAMIAFAGLLLSLPAFSALPQGGQAPNPGQNPGRPPGGWQHGARPGTPPGATGAPAAAPAPPAATNGKPVVEKTPTSGEQFYLVASLDLQKSQLLLKHPTEVTQLVAISDKTKIQDVTGASLMLSDLRAGDTVWVSTSGSGATIAATSIRKGQMTVADLHRFYLDYPEIK
jgi:hypothetical protein